jgi:hypothetical protein
VDLGLRGRRALVTGATACIGRHQTACRADEQSHAELRFELRDELRHGGLSDVHPPAQVENEPVSITLMKVSSRGESVHSLMAQDRRS